MRADCARPRIDFEQATSMLARHARLLDAVRSIDAMPTGGRLTVVRR
jgi:hypothetical protein